jgi:hypothetical protein
MKNFILLFIFLLACGCIQEEKTTTTTIMQTTTTKMTTTTTTTTTSTTTTTTTTTSTTTTTLERDAGCAEFCRGEGLPGGSCQINIFECQRRMMKKIPYREKLCPDKRYDTCCCKTDESIEFESYFLFSKGTSNP